MSEQSVFGGKPVLQFRHESDRRNFLRMAGLVGVGASFAVGGALHGATRADAAPSASGDLDILNYALTLEYLESDFYWKGLQAGVVSGRELELVTPIADHEKQHVAAITSAVKAMGGTPVAKPMIKFPSGTFDSRDSFLTTAATFEEVGVTAYHGQVPLIKSVDVLGAAASIAGVESRHAAILDSLTGKNPFPAPIEMHRSMAEVLVIIKPFIS